MKTNNETIISIGDCMINIIKLFNHQKSARHTLISFTLALLFELAPGNIVYGGWSQYGVGMQAIENNTLANAELYLETKTTWLNNITPSKPFILSTNFNLPMCDSIASARLLLTLWGGTANYTCKLQARVNGSDVPNMNPLIFGGTNDVNPYFTSTKPNVYGSGYGVWLVSVPIPGNLFHSDNSTNLIELIVDTDDNFDGRIQQITLCAIYQKAALSNYFQYVLIEGTGDIYTNTTSGKTASRQIQINNINTNYLISARLHAIYTYGDKGQNDWLLFNGIKLGGDDVACHDKTIDGFDYGPDVVTFDVSKILQESNELKFTVSANDGVPFPGESSLRPSFSILEVTRSEPDLLPNLNISQNIVIKWPLTQEIFQLECTTNVNSGQWSAVTNIPVVIDGQYTVILPPSNKQQFFRLRKVQ